MHRIFCFMKGYRYHETKGYLYTLCTLAHKTSTQRRQKARGSFNKSNQVNQADDGRRTVIVYGDASLVGTKKECTPIPVKRMQRELSRKEIVIPVDEFRTSITCCKWHRKLDQKYEAQTLVCNHRYAIDMIKLRLLTWCLFMFQKKTKITTKRTKECCNALFGR
ncbi:hypothetical protein AB4K20DRAFT_1881934 [Rhizopus microsporus]